MSGKIVFYNQMIVKFYNCILLITLSLILISCNNKDETKSSKTDKSLINNNANKNRDKNNLKGTNLENLDNSNKPNNINSQNILNTKKDSAIFIEAEKDAILYANMYCQYMIAMKNNNKELATQYQNEAKKIHQQIYPKYSDSKKPETVIFKNKAEELADACMKELRK